MRAHFDVHAVERGQIGVMHAAPVGHDEAFESPFILENFIEQIVVFTTVLAAEQVVGAHEGQHARLLHHRAKRRQVNLAQGALIHFHIDRIPLIFLAVRGKMFGAGGDALRLLALDVMDGHARGQERVLAQVFEIPAAQRGALDVERRSEHDVLVALSGLLADYRAVSRGQIRIPRGRQAQRRRHGGRKINNVCIRPPFFLTHAYRAVAHLQPGNAEAGNAGNCETRIGMDQRNLFFEREAGKQIFDTGLDWFGVVKIRRALLRASVPGTCRQNREGKQWYDAMLDFGYKSHNFSAGSIWVKSIRSLTAASRRAHAKRDSSGAFTGSVTAVKPL